MYDLHRTSECRLHGDDGREPWGDSLRAIEVLRCDHLGDAYVVEMYLVAGNEEQLYRSHHIHFVRDGLREVHALDEDLSPEDVQQIWVGAVTAMERGDRPRNTEAWFHRQCELP